jgi:hypothetical protein
VDVVPAQALEREGVEREPARVEEPVDLDPREVRRAQRPELLGAVLLEMPGIARLLAPAGASVRTFGVDSTTRPPGPVSALKRSSTSSGLRTCSIVCRKTTASAGSS